MTIALVAESPASGQANREALDLASGAVTVPTGTIYLDKAPVLSKAQQGLLLAGNGSVLMNVHSENNWVTGRALAVRPGGEEGVAVLSFYEQKPKSLEANQCGWLFNGNGADGLGFYPDRVIRVGPGEAVPDSKLPHFMRAYHAVPFTGTHAITVPKGHGFRVGDDVFATDGPLINEVVPEYRRVSAVGGLGDAIMLNKPLTRTYLHGSLVGGPIPKAMAFQGLRFISTWGPVLIQQAVDVSFTDDVFDHCLEWVAVIGSARISFINCIMPSGFQSSTSHDLSFRGCTIREVQGEQAAYNLLFEYCRLGPGPFDAKVQCTGWRLRDNVSTGSLFIYDHWEVDDHIAYGPVTVRGHKALVRDLWSAHPVLVQSAYQGAPPLAGTGIVLDNIRAPVIHCDPGTSGEIRRRRCPVTGDTTNWLIQ